MSDVVDRYQMRARVQPAILAALPLAVTLAVVFGLQRDLLSGVVAFAGAAGVTYIIAHLVRDRGRRLEPALWESWGGRRTPSSCGVATGTVPQRRTQVDGSSWAD